MSGQKLIAIISDAASTGKFSFLVFVVCLAWYSSQFFFKGTAFVAIEMMDLLQNIPCSLLLVCGQHIHSQVGYRLVFYRYFSSCRQPSR